MPLLRPRGLVVRGRHNELGGGASRGNTFHIYDEDGNLYYGKQGSADFPYAVVNEHVAARLARASGLRVPDHGLSVVDGQHFFLSHGSPFRPALEHLPDFLACPVWREEFAALLAFDTWLINVDRHFANFLLEKAEPEGDGAGPVYRVHAIDHDRALFSDGLALAALYQKDRIEPFAIHKALPMLIKQKVTLKRSHVDEQVARIQAVSPTDIAGFLSDIPNALLPPDEKSAVESIILRRQLDLAKMVDAMCLHAEYRPSFV